jgi:seryl-tRNA synthetase
MSKKVMQKIVSIEKPTELSAEKVELAAIDDLRGYVKDAKDLLDRRNKLANESEADVDKISSLIDRYNKEYTNKGDNIENSISTLSSEVSRKINDVESMAKELGITVRDIPEFKQITDLLNDLKQARTIGAKLDLTIVFERV